MLGRMLSHGLLVLVAVAMFGCTNSVEPAEEAIDWKAVQESPEFKQLQAIYEKGFEKLVSRQVSRADIERAIVSDDVNVVAEVMGLTSDEITEMVDAFAASITYFEEHYPQIQPGNKALLAQCSSADINEAIATWDERLVAYNAHSVDASKLAGTAGIQGIQRVSCAWAPYTSCLVIAGIASAAITSGIAPITIIAYAAGAIICVCEYCEGGWVNWLC